MEGLELDLRIGSDAQASAREVHRRTVTGRMGACKGNGRSERSKAHDHDAGDRDAGHREKHMDTEPLGRRLGV